MVRSRWMPWLRWDEPATMIVVTRERAAATDLLGIAATFPKDAMASAQP